MSGFFSSDMSKIPQKSFTVVYLLQYRWVVAFIQLLLVFQCEFVASCHTIHKTFTLQDTTGISIPLVSIASYNSSWTVRFSSVDDRRSLIYRPCYRKARQPWCPKRTLWSLAMKCSGFCKFADVHESIITLNQQEIYEKKQSVNRNQRTHTQLSPTEFLLQIHR